MNSTRLKTVRSALWRCPNSTVALRLLEKVVKVTNLEVVKIVFRHLPILLSFFFSQPSALTRAVLKTKHPPTPNLAHICKNRYLNSRLVILHASELATELFDELQSPICMFTMSISRPESLPNVVASRACYYSIKQNGV